MLRAVLGEAEWLDGDFSAGDLLNPAVDVGAVVRCDEVAWALAGVSMAGWNVIISALLAAVWVLAARAK